VCGDLLLKNKNMKKITIGIAGLAVVGILSMVGMRTEKPNPSLGVAKGYTGAEGVGIIVKTGTKMDQVLSLFTLTERECVPGQATSTPPVMCRVTLYQGREVKVFYTAPQSLTVAQSPFRFAIGAFPFDGSIEYKNASVSDAEKERRLIQRMGEGGVGDIYSIIYEP
jgi:hypothetical protein